MKSAIKPNSEVLKGLNNQQTKAVTFNHGPLLIIAGAGTGKTTVLTKRIVWLIEQDLAKSEEILALTFTEKAANEMQERVDQMMPLGYSEINISTFHSFAKKILQEHALDIGLPGDFKVLNETQAWMMMQNHLLDFELDYYRPMGNANKFIHALLKHFELAKREDISPEKYLEYAQGLQMNLDNVDVKKKARKKGGRGKGEGKTEEVDPAEVTRITEVANAFHRYQKMILDAGYLDYSDLINYTTELFKKRPKILERYRQQFKYVLVDEFQDTDKAQYELVKLLAFPPARHASQLAGVAGRQNNITVVGDDDQSIYKFRGASISNILQFEKDYPNCEKVMLVDNYRSSQPILDLAYDFIQLNNPERLEFKLNLNKKLISHKSEPAQIEVLHVQTVYDEAVAVADKISLLMETDSSLTFSDFAILVRANNHADPFLTELSKRGMPYIFVANRGLYKKPFILDLVAYLKLLDNYHDSDNLFRVLSFKKFRIPAADLIAITRMTKKKALSVYEAIKQVPALVKVSEAAQKKISELINFIDKHANYSREMSVTALLLKILEDLDLRSELVDNAAERSEDIGLLRKFYKKAQEFEAENDDKTSRAFLNLLRLEEESGNTGELAFDPNVGPETVKIMTIHLSKGLEFKCVFIVNLVEARFPSRERHEAIELSEALITKEILPEGDAHLMEERRLFYVAVTRAKYHLYLTWADNYGGESFKKPSRFLVETRLETIQSKSKSTGQVEFKSNPKLPLPPHQQLALPETFSWTSVSSFLKCPLEFKYKYLYQIPWPGNSYTSFGSTIHKAIQLFSQLLKQTSSVTQNDLFASLAEDSPRSDRVGAGGESRRGTKPADFKYPPLSKLHKIYEENWIDDWYESKLDQENFKKRGYLLLENYYNHLTSYKLLPKEVEKFFKLKLGKYKYVGVIDCIFENLDGSINIVDYKTSKTARKKLDKVDKKQLLSYQLAAQEFLHKKVKNLSYWDLEDLSSIVEFVGTKEEISLVEKELENNIDEIVDAIKNDSFQQLDLRKQHECEFRHLES